MQRLPALASLCMVPASSGQGLPRYVCYWEGPTEPAETRAYNLYVTDALELWNTSFTPESLEKHKAQHGLDGAEDYSVWFRVASDRHTVSLTLKDDSSAYLTISRGAETLTFELSKVPSLEAAPQLQALMLGLAEQACRLEKQLAALKDESPSPRKKSQPGGQQLFLPDPDSRRSAPGPVMRKWMPGESLINPGFKSKKPASGVDFDAV
ncbi:protein PAXX isoform X1 [Monodelphis domestica]|uniref:PAXX non-homologous end joining factor n=1 Tax=Monodelphis domestica TaxID=13616 RepID=F6S4N8_MONDO|nr:protein PAXX isoform X1 [Monodelphis domestica]